MSPARARTELVLALVAGLLTSVAQAQSPDACRQVAAARGLQPSITPCQTLAAMVVALNPAIREAADRILVAPAAEAAAALSPRDLQATHTQSPGLGGSLAQAQAVPGVEPVGVAAGSIVAVGTDGGQAALAAIGVNPALFFLGDIASRQLAKYSRFADLTLFVPVAQPSTEEATEPETRPRYFGARLRLNVHGLSAGSAVWDRSVALFANWITRAGRNLEKVQALLATAPDLAACVDALVAVDGAARVPSSCGAPLELEVDLAEADQLREELALVRAAVDNKYFGADIRLDSGDPTMGTVPDASGTFLYAGLAMGRTIGGTPTAPSSASVRTRLGVRHAKLDSATEAEFAVDGGLGFEFARRVDELELTLSGGLDFRYGNAADAMQESLQTNFTMLRGSLTLPVTAAQSLTLSFGTPVDGDVTPQVSVHFNWGLLMSRATGR